MTQSSAWPWRAFNTIMRVSGLVAALFGSGLLVWVALLILHPTILNRLHGVGTDRDLAPPLLMAGAWFLMFGVCILRARTYRPDLGDAGSLVDPVGVKLQQYYPPSRTWWTGDPKPLARSVRSSVTNPVRAQTEPKSFRSPAGESGFSSKIRKILGAGPGDSGLRWIRPSWLSALRLQLPTAEFAGASNATGRSVLRDPRPRLRNCRRACSSKTSRAPRGTRGGPGNGWHVYRRTRRSSRVLIQGMPGFYWRPRGSDGRLEVPMAIEERRYCAGTQRVTCSGCVGR